MLQENSTAQSEAEKRVISVKTKAGHPVKYSGNPAELPGARYETGLALRRAGAFQMLIKNNASRLKSGQMCVEDIDNIPFDRRPIGERPRRGYLYIRESVPRHSYSSCSL